MTLGRPRLHLRRTASTNARARELAAGGAPHGTLVTASEQTAGRGRQGRTWAAPAGRSLLMSLVLRAPLPDALPLAAAVAVADACGPQARIKWPNDVLLGAGKAAGILVEARLEEGWAVLGVGINVAVDLRDLPPDVRARAASLQRSPADVEAVLEDLLGALEHRLGADTAETLTAWRERDALAGRPVQWSGGAGVARGIDGEGRLIVELEGGGRTALGAGEVHLGAAAQGEAAR